MNRIETHPILRANQNQKYAKFLLDGTETTGIENETVASALMALGYSHFSLHPKDGAPQGLFCANGQCSQCTMLIDGIPKKACMTHLTSGMEVRTLRGLPVLPPRDNAFVQAERRSIRTDILIIGAGPAGLAAAAELGNMGFQVLVADDKAAPGGKLIVQTHKFFGSEAACYAGVRGIDIAAKIRNEALRHPSVSILLNAPVIGLYKDRKAGIFLNYESYVLVEFTALVVASGAREKALQFPGWDLPGVLGAGAFQTLVNRDLVKAYEKILIVGSGNVGLITAYHALQAGIMVVGIFEVAGKVNGYRVHADKIRRLGVPISLNSTILRAEGSEKVERALISSVDEHARSIPGTEKSYDVDAVLVAVGLSPCSEFFEQARRYGILAVTAGDAGEIAEASSAIYSGKIAANELGQMLGKKVARHPDWESTRQILASHPGNWYERVPLVLSPEWKPMFFCSEEIPCNPCTTVCPLHAIKLKPNHGTIMDIPYFASDRCTGCGACVAICPGLAITLVRSIGNGLAEVVLPWEFNVDFEIGAMKELVDQDGNSVQIAPVVSMYKFNARNTWLITFRVDRENASKISGVRVSNEVAPIQSLSLNAFDGADDALLDTVLCRCERVTLREVVEFIKKYHVRDANQLKSIRVGMGACGGKTCAQLIAKAFSIAGIDGSEIEPMTQRPLYMEVPMNALVNEGLYKLGGIDAGIRGAP